MSPYVRHGMTYAKQPVAGRALKKPDPGEHESTKRDAPSDYHAYGLRTPREGDPFPKTDVPPIPYVGIDTCGYNPAYLHQKIHRHVEIVTAYDSDRQIVACTDCGVIL